MMQLWSIRLCLQPWVMLRGLFGWPAKASLCSCMFGFWVSLFLPPPFSLPKPSPLVCHVLVLNRDLDGRSVSVSQDLDVHARPQQGWKLQLWAPEDWEEILFQRLLIPFTLQSCQDGKNYLEKASKKPRFWCVLLVPLDLIMPICPKWSLFFESVCSRSPTSCLGLVFSRAEHETVCTSSSWMISLLCYAFSSEHVPLIAEPMPSDMIPHGSDRAMVLEETEVPARKRTKPQQVLAINCHFDWRV